MGLQTRKLSEALTLFRSPVFSGVLVAFFIVTRFWPAGFDASLYYLRYPPVNATTPAWVYLVTYPLSLIGWPLSWQVLATATILVTSVVYAMRGNRRWWIVAASTPVLYNAWWGQIEIFSVLGVILGILILQKKIHPAWIGIVWLALAIKPQTNYGLLLLLTWWAWRELGFKALIPGGVITLGVIGLTFVIWPGWLQRLLGVYGNVHLGMSNASLWPYGLVAWLFAFLPVRMGPDRRIRMVAAASLLGSPYFTLHHCITLMVLTDYPVVLLLSWIPAVMIVVTRDWAQFAWVLPVGIMAIDLSYLILERRRAKQTSVSPGEYESS